MTSARERTTIPTLLERRAAALPDHEALVHPHLAERVAYAGLATRADALARGLIALGLSPGDRVALWADNHPDWIPLQLAAARAGLILVPANPAFVRDEIAYVLRHARVRAAIAAPGLKARENHDALLALRAAGAFPELEHVLALDGPASAGAPAPFLPLSHLLTLAPRVPAADARARAAAIRPDDPACILYTSGTTGFPKGVVLSHHNVAGNAAAVARRMHAAPRDRILLGVPLFHCFGCVICVLGALSSGATLVQLPRFDPLRALEALDRERCTILHGVPAMFLALLEHPERARFDLSALRAGAMGGATCPPDLLRRVADELGCAGIANAYGLTECSPAVCISAPDDPPERRFHTAGLPIDGVEVRVRAHADDDAAPPAPSPIDQGEIQVRGPCVMQGYLDDPEATAASFTADGWLRTGDLGVIEPDGRLRITGRIKDLIIRCGENVMPAEVEDALRAHPAVRDAAVFGVPHPRLGEEVHAAVILRPGRAATEDELLRALATRLAPFKRPARIHVVDAFPTTSSGKVRKADLRERFAAAPARPEP